MQRPLAGANDSTITKINVVRPVAVIQRSPAMDRFLSVDDTSDLYTKWPSTFPAKISLQGGVELITCEMVAGLSWGQLVKAFGTSKAKLFRDTAKQHSEV